jgi:hypothetical protein
MHRIRPAERRPSGYERTDKEAKIPSPRGTRRRDSVERTENAGRARTAPAADPTKLAAYTAPTLPRRKDSGTPTAVPARKNGTARRRKNKAKEGQEEGSQRSRKGSNETCWEARNASSYEEAERRTTHVNIFPGIFAILGRSRWRATPEAPTPSIAWEMMSGTT